MLREISHVPHLFCLIQVFLQAHYNILHHQLSPNPCTVIPHLYVQVLSQLFYLIHILFLIQVCFQESIHFSLLKFHITFFMENFFTLQLIINTNTETYQYIIFFQYLLFIFCVHNISRNGLLVPIPRLQCGLLQSLVLTIVVQSCLPHLPFILIIK